MRLNEEEKETLKKAVLLLDEKAKIYLFGSRVDDNKKGGDIDLLILSEKIKRRDLRQIKQEFFIKFGEQRLDLVIPNNYNSSFVNFILDDVVEL